MRLKRIALCIVACAVAMTLMACSASKYKDGVYKKEAAEFHQGWKETVEITIINGKISKVSWDAIAQSDKIPVGKKQYSKSGLYGMLAAGAIDEWCDQAKAAEDFIMRYGVDAIVVDSEGMTDSIAGCTIGVDQLTVLALQCLEQARK